MRALLAITSSTMPTTTLAETDSPTITSRMVGRGSAPSFHRQAVRGVTLGSSAEARRVGISPGRHGGAQHRLTAHAVAWSRIMERRAVANVA
ncbi:hypothetical protein MTO96_047679 [Rhipicephalus appendiculatus]